MRAWLARPHVISGVEKSRTIGAKTRRRSRLEYALQRGEIRRAGFVVTKNRARSAQQFKAPAAKQDMMQPSMFNLRVPLPARNEVFLMNTLTDAQLVVSADVAALLDRSGELADSSVLDEEEREALGLLSEHGFIVDDRASERRRLDEYFTSIRTDSTQLGVTVLTTLQCNFACDYCFQGDHGDYNKFAEKMSLETAGRVAAWIEDELDRVNPDRFVLTFFG